MKSKENIPRKRNSKCKGPETGRRDSKKVTVAVVQRARDRENGRRWRNRSN